MNCDKCGKLKTLNFTVAAMSGAAPGLTIGGPAVAVAPITITVDTSKVNANPGLHLILCTCLR